MNTPPYLPSPRQPREPAAFDSMRTLGHLPPTYRANRRRLTRLRVLLFAIMCLAITALPVVWLAINLKR